LAAPFSRFAATLPNLGEGVKRKPLYRLQRRWRNLTLVHLPLHASWLNQIEIAFSIIQRKLLTPNDFENLALLARTLNEFERHYKACTTRASRDSGVA
jgi:hypothetical protein